MKVNRLGQFYPILAVTVVVFIAVAALTLTNTAVRPMIEWQKEQKIQRMLNEIFPDMTSHTSEGDIYIINSDGAEIGFAFLAIGKGYGGKIDILVGLETDMRIKGISIISHLETPGLGTKITKPDFTDRFKGINIDDVGEVDTITGSTISTKAVINAVRITAIEKVKALTGRE